MRTLPHPLLVLLPIVTLLTTAPRAREVPVPEALQPWKVWVAARNPEHACPINQGFGTVCVTYGSLKLDLGDRGGKFVQAVTVFGAQWVSLPGSAGIWPRDVRDGGSEVPVVRRNGVPQARLGQGEHILTGSFSWTEAPPALRIPQASALIALRLKGREVEAPELVSGNALQLGARVQRDTGEAESPMSLRVYRKWIDGIPMRLETFLTVSVSGRDREVVTGRLLPEGSAVQSIESDLPLRIGPDGKLRVQLRSGEHAVTVVSRFLAPVTELAMVRQDSLWPEEEIWSFEAHRDLRVVELSGAPLIDPSQSGLPAQWRELPAYRMQPGDTLRLTEKQRGNPNPESGTLSLQRQLWLDFSGKGFTSKDMLTGMLPVRSRLEMGGGYRLGRADIDGQPVMITSLEKQAGVEIPAGRLNLVALSRFDRAGAPLSATGWNQSFQSVSATLHLPPGWKLIHAGGPDSVGNSWVNEWSLWDVFLLCILTLAVLRLAGWKIASLGLVTFVLLSQEQGWSGLLWLNLLAALGLWRVLPAGRLRNVANIYRIASLVLMAAIWIPFAVAQARKALYPQLDGPGSTAFHNANYSLLSGAGVNRVNFAPAAQGGNGQLDDQMERADEAMPAAPPIQNPPARNQANMQLRKLGPSASGAGYESKAKTNDFATRRNRFSTQASKVQSGPGEPEWNWESSTLYWSGPVQDGETLNLILVRPWLTRILRALQAVLPGALLLLLAFPSAAGRFAGGSAPSRRMGGAAVLLALLLLPMSVRADYPPESLLKELETRMTAPPACTPECATLTSGRIGLKADRIIMALVFDVADTTIAQLPQAGEGQLALQGIRLGAKAAASATRLDNGRIGIALPRGRHVVTVEGRLTGPRLELNFGDGARNLSVEAPEYSVQGLRNGSTEGSALVLVRSETVTEAHRGPELTPDPVPPFVEVERTLVLDQEWTLETRVLRVAPRSGAFTVEVPLLPFEHPTTAGMAQSKGAAMVSLQEGQWESRWHSVVDRAQVLKLAAGPLDQRAETWIVDASSRWHVETSGIPPILPPEGEGEPRWKPMPGDTLVLSISEPEAATGPVKTIETASLTLTPGKRESSANLHLRVRAGQGDVTRVTLPSGARLESLTLAGRPQTLTQREGVLALPLHPGVQDIVLDWKQEDGIHLWQKTPEVGLEDDAANLSLAINVPSDRWVLWVGGNAVGPALLLWGVLAVLFGIALLLGRARITPLGSLDWALLFLGTSMVNLYATAPLLALFLSLRYREKHAASWSPRRHNLIQVLCAGLALIAFGTLLAAVPEGLLSSPDMQVTGNGSYGGNLHWFQDRSAGVLPTGWVVSLPMWIYRVAMLVWSLWLAWRLLQWLRWSWERYSAGGFWKPLPPRTPPTRNRDLRA